MEVNDGKHDRLKRLIGWAIPGIAGVVSVWSAPTSTATGKQWGTPERSAPAPITFANTLNQNTLNLYAAHRSHSSHSSHASHSSHVSHYSSSGGYVAPAPSPPAAVPPASPPSSAGPTPGNSGNAGGTSSPPRVSPSDSTLRDLVTKVQIGLFQKGYDPGVIDGELGPTTRSALKEFQVRHSLKPTGTMTTETLDALGIPLH